MKNVIISFFAIALLISCKETAKEISPSDETAMEEVVLSDVEQTIASVETAHNKEGFMSKEVIKFDIDINFGGNPALDGTIYMTTDSKYVRIDKTNGTSIIYDGNKVWMTPQDATDQGARFDIFTWTYFFALPYKLADEGTNTKLSNETDLHKVIRLDFDAGTGDAPDDWYDVYVNKENNVIDYAGYIVTFGGTDANKAAENAHAIGYEAYQKLDNISIAHQWKFYNYSNMVDLSTVIGDATLTNLDFIELEESMFATPENAVEVKL